MDQNQPSRSTRRRVRRVHDALANGVPLMDALRAVPGQPVSLDTFIACSDALGLEVRSEWREAPIPDERKPVLPVADGRSSWASRGGGYLTTFDVDVLNAMPPEHAQGLGLCAASRGRGSWT